jgi:hypothetical protein
VCTHDSPALRAQHTRSRLWGAKVWASLLLGAIACGKPSSDARPSAEALALAEAIEGVWTMDSNLNDDCPSGSGLPPLKGDTEWIRDGAQITIRARNGHWSATPMDAVDADRLQHRSSITEAGCTLDVEITMTVYDLDSERGEGRYDAVMASDGGVACSVLAASFGLPSDCSVQGAWKIER